MDFTVSDVKSFQPEQPIVSVESPENVFFPPEAAGKYFPQKLFV